MLVKVEGKDTNSVVGALQRHTQSLPEGVMRSLIGTAALKWHSTNRLRWPQNVDIYFCDPQSPWQRGTDESTNRLLRQYFPKKNQSGCAISDDLNLVATRLNTRPITTLGFQTPAYKLNEML
jgi:IS30 family transposase